jgi:integrase
MGIFQRYIKRDKNGNPVLGKDGKPKREGAWFIQFPYGRDPETGKITYRTERASFSKKKAEKMFRTKMDSFAEKDKLGSQIDLEMTFSELIEWGLSQEVMKSKASSADDETRARHLKSVFGSFKAARITPLMVDNFRIRMKEAVSDKTKKGFSGSSINKMVSLARRIYYIAIDAGKVRHNPFARRGIYKEEPMGRYVPDEEFKGICSFLPDYLKGVAVAAYYTGMRRGEILELGWDRVDLNSGFIDLTPRDTKTAEARRIFFSSLNDLKEVLVKAAESRSGKCGLVFTKPDGTPVPKWYMERLFKKACQKAKVGPYRFHDLRHTFNTNMLKAGVDQVVIMKLTGHKTNAMFARYSHLDKEIGEKAMGKLEELLSGINDEKNLESNPVRTIGADEESNDLPFSSA